MEIRSARPSYSFYERESSMMNLFASVTGSNYNSVGEAVSNR